MTHGDTILPVPPAAFAPAAARPPRWAPALPGALVDAVLRAPLGAKLAGANALIVVAAGAVVLWTRHARAGGGEIAAVLLAALAASAAANVLLVRLALRPVRELERVAARVWRGDLAARVAPSPLADRDIARLGDTLNVLLDSLMADRARLHHLAAQVIRAGEAEQARIARELHDSAAQTLAALTFQASAAARAPGTPADLAERLETVRALAVDALEEIRTLSHTIHPRVLDDLGLPAGLEALARSLRGHGIDVSVRTRGPAPRMPRPVASVLYRVAQEALGNAARHAAPHAVQLRLTVGSASATLEITDDGCGFDLDALKRSRRGIGLFTMEERLTLVDGTLVVASEPGRGTAVTAVVPLAGC